MSKKVCNFAVAKSSINMDIPDLKTLKGEELYYYCSEAHPNKEFRETTKLLRYAVMSPNAFYAILERVIANNLTMCCHYPAFDNPEDIKGKEILGDIPDGCLYIK